MYLRPKQKSQIGNQFFPAKQRSSDLRQAWRLPDAFECTHSVIGSLVCCSNLNSCHPICKLACFIADPPSFHIASISERERETNDRKYIGAETRTEARNLWGAYMCRTTSPYPTWAVTWTDSFYSEGLHSRCLSDAWSQAMDVGKNGPSSFASFVRPLNKTKLKHLKTCPLQKEVLLWIEVIYNVELRMQLLVWQELRIRLWAHHRDSQVCSCRLCCLRILGYFGVSNISSQMSVFWNMYKEIVNSHFRTPKLDIMKKIALV